MKTSETRISIIIPTHNRSATITRLLDKIATQTYPMHLIEVLAIANACTDNTLTVLSEYQAPYSFRFDETNGVGPAVPRNKGASLATGDILIFIDDDVNPSETFVQGHVDAHVTDRTVVIGYLPIPKKNNESFFRADLRGWWENKFQPMRKAGYRFGYTDLLSGNFSIRPALFNEVRGFMTRLRCRDDYEIGVRLIRAKADFRFSIAAMAEHLDEVTDLDRSLKRKREEGRTDVALSRMHAHLTHDVQNEYRRNGAGVPESRTAFLILHFPWLTDLLARSLRAVMGLVESVGMRQLWNKISIRLHNYWYWRGMIDELPAKKELTEYYAKQPNEELIIADIDLVNGREAEAKIDQLRPHVLNVFYKENKIGTVEHVPGAERLKSIHLRRLLAKKFPRQTIDAIEFGKQFEKKNTVLQHHPGISVIVCTRNRTEQLSNCLYHLLKMDYRNFEVIVVDNAPSTEDTKQLTANLPVKYIREERQGLDWARNSGIEAATHEIIAFTDDDVRVDENWLHAIANTFSDKDIMGASGNVLPAELETPSQRLFEEGFGGMGHGSKKIFFHKDRISKKQLLWASGMGVGANMAFRKNIFQLIGGFDTALDVGTPTHGGGDVEFFHRLVANGHLFVYDPSIIVYHYHRRDAKALKKQIYDNGRSFGCFLIDCYKKRTVPRNVIIKFWLKEWLLKWNLANLIGKRKIPASLSLMELRGMLSAPAAYAKSRKLDLNLRK